RNPRCPLVEGGSGDVEVRGVLHPQGRGHRPGHGAAERPGGGRVQGGGVCGGKLGASYLMFGQYDGFVIVGLPDSRAAAATSLAVSSTGAFEHLETHELIEAEDLNPILEQAKGITSQLPGT